jgi:dTMP kinase
MRHREAATNTHADIHEQDMSYLATCRETGRAAAKFYGWTVIECVRDGQMRSIEDIHEEIYRHVRKCLEG